MKPLSEFHKDSSNMKGHISQCKACRSIVRAAEYRKDPQKWVERNRRYVERLKLNPVKYRRFRQNKKMQQFRRDERNAKNLHD